MARQQEKPEHHVFGEVVGLILLGLGTLLFLALISFQAKDVPEGVPIIAHASPANHITHNFIGPVGAIVAGFFYFLVGAGAYVVAVVLLGYGGAKLLAPSLPIGRRTLWVVGAVVSFACLIDLQHVFLTDWKSSMGIPGKGGWLGHWLGSGLCYHTLGTIGSWIFLGILYLTCLVMMTGIHPIQLVRKCHRLSGRSGRRNAARSGWPGRMSGKSSRLRAASWPGKPTRSSNSSARKTPCPRPRPDLQDEVDPERRALGRRVPRPTPQIIDTAIASKSSRCKEKLEPKEPVSYENYALPGVDLLDEPDEEGRQAADPEELKEIQATLIETLAQFGISVAPGDITRGPTITRYEVYPAKGIRVDKIVALERDLARATRAERINILAPIPGKDTVGIEIANSRKMKVTLRELLESDDWHNTKARIPLALGKDVYGNTIIADLAQMPHLLVAGTTGSGKSVCINSLIASMLYRSRPRICALS